MQLYHSLTHSGVDTTRPRFLGAIVNEAQPSINLQWSHYIKM